MIHHLEYWLSEASAPEKDQSSSASAHDSEQSHQEEVFSMPDFPLFPLSRGFQITLKKLLIQYKKTLLEQGYCDIGL